MWHLCHAVQGMVPERDKKRSSGCTSQPRSELCAHAGLLRNPPPLAVIPPSTWMIHIHGDCFCAMLMGSWNHDLITPGYAPAGAMTTRQALAGPTHFFIPGPSDQLCRLSRSPRSLFRVCSSLFAAVSLPGSTLCCPRKRYKYMLVRF